MTVQPIDILERFWKYSEFKPLQEEIITSVLDNQDTLALLPTGGGKSLCYQIPAIIMDGICIVISPLLALMDDQVSNLKDKGIKAMAIKGGIGYQDLDALLDNCIYGNYKFLYISPERLQQPLVQQRIQQMNVNLIAVDEAHCISQWGHDFRPAYRSINLLRNLQPTICVLALTATAKPKVIEEIITELNLISPQIFKASYNRSNIAYHVIKTEDKNYKLIQALNNKNSSAIVYVRSRYNAESISTILKQRGIKSDFFHGGLNNELKSKKLEDFLNEKTLVMVATTAFGMGIDKADVRTIIHINLPESLESYYQESGRAGRDGLKSNSMIILDNNDESRLREQFLKVLPEVEMVKKVYNKLCNYLYIAYGEGYLNTYNLNFNDFCKTYSFSPTKVFNILKIFDRTSIIQMDPRFSHQTRLQFIIESGTLINYIKQNQEIETTVKSILRTYGGIMDSMLKINIEMISNKAGLSQKKVLEVLNKLKKDEIIEFEYKHTDTVLTFLEPREDDKTINRISKDIKQNNKVRTNQVNSVIEYINNDTECRNAQLLSYFGEELKVNCGCCSVCIVRLQSKIAIDPKELRKKIILLLEQRHHSSRSIVNKLSKLGNEEHILMVIRQMLEHEIIELTEGNTYKIKHT